MKLKKKYLIVIGIIFILFNLYICTQVFAEGVLVDDVVNYMSTTNKGVTQKNIVTNILSTILAVIQVGATGYFIIVFTIVGIKYLMISLEAKQAEIKVKYRAQLINTFILGVVVFAATGIFRIIYELLNP